MAECNCKYYPTVIVPGIGQSKVDLYSLDGKRVKCAWPLDLDTKALIKDITPAALKMLVTRNDTEFCSVLKKAVCKAVDPLHVNKEGVPNPLLRPVDYDGKSLAEVDDADRRYIYRMVPLESLSEVIGEDHVFFFAYNSFGEPYETAKALNAYIQNVKKKTGHDKVNLVPVSLGGSIATAYFDAYGYKEDIHRVCYFVPAANGSSLIGDLFERTIDLSDPESLFGFVLSSKDAKMITSLAKYLPENGLEHIANTFIDAVWDTFIGNCPGMWALLPYERFEESYKKYLCVQGRGTLKAKAERFYRAQSNLRELLLLQEKRGVEFFSVCGFDRELIPFAGSKDVNSDTVVDFKSASLGGTAAPLGEKLPADYKRSFERCTDPSHNHISPSGTVDLSTAIFPDATFCFCGQQHDDTAYNDVALAISKEILSNEDFHGVYSDPRYPQFNGSRNIRKLRYDLIPKAKELLKLELHELVIKELEAALAEAEAIFDDTFIENNDKAAAATQRLWAAVTAAKPEYIK